MFKIDLFYSILHIVKHKQNDFKSISNQFDVTMYHNNSIPLTSV